MKRQLTLILTLLVCGAVFAQSKHAPKTNYPSYEGLVMAGYQGWFHNPDGGVMYPDESKIHIDMWPDVSEYEKTYPTGLKLKDGSTARFFCSDDESTVATHFKWMKQYGLDGVFMQRFYNNCRPHNGSREWSTTVLRHALKYSERYSRAISVMYDLSGLNPQKGETCDLLIDDWKYLVDSLKVTSYSNNNNYLFYKGRPLVVIWGVGFPDRPYDIKDIKLAEFIDFLHNDPEYGGCSVMLGVPTFWRELFCDCVHDPYLHELIKMSDLVLPWMVQRFTPLLHFDMGRYHDIIEKDSQWCSDNGVGYVPLVYPGFSWHNLSREGAGIGGPKPVGSIPRQGGTFYWDQIYTAISAGAKMLYVAMFDEVNEGTAIFKCSDNPPVSDIAKFIDMDGMPSDHYLFLTGEGAKMLRGEKPLSPQMPKAAYVYTPEGIISNSMDGDMAANPFIKHLYTADPSAHVWKDGRLYVYASHDIDPPRGCDLMDKYHIFSTDDMVNWTDHGQILSSDDVPWGRKEGGFMWAPDCAYKRGKYYFYFPHPSETITDHSWRIGVAVSKKPASDFKVRKWIEGVPPYIDPCVFVDDDGMAYIYNGGGGHCFGGRLAGNMQKLDGDMIPMKGLKDFHEGTWVHKYNGKYYLSYPDNHLENGVQYNRMHYAMSDSPLGPWEYKGIFLEKTDCDTSHGSIVEFKGQWYLFYHGCQISQMGNLRSICVDKLYYNPDGTIQPVIQRGHCDLPRR